MRLNRYLALCGVASRRKCDALIEEGKVTINGKPAVVGTVVNARVDEVRVADKLVVAKNKVFFVMYKPLNVLTTLSDPRERPTIADYLGHIPYRIFPVGRLDFDSEGLLLMTNDGALAHRVQHPTYKLEKEYKVTLSRELTPAEHKQFEEGITLDDGTTARTQLLRLDEKTYRVILTQGWHRQFRRMFETFEIEVTRLLRTRICNIPLGPIRPGEIRELEPALLADLRKTLNF